MNEKQAIPGGVAAVLRALEQAGQQAYLVGGCVRDRYMGCPPHDYDITTSALPEEILEIFRGERVIETGLQHGTVTVLTADGPVEVTTYRQDGDYADHRHPESVTFTRSLREDLARRDFTMNAMAMDEAGEMVDPFGGRADIQKRLIRCVGEPARRFEEDALRILRGLRFAARLGFALEPATAAAMNQKKQLLLAIAQERVFAELCGLLEGAYASEVIEAHREILAVVLPEWQGERTEMLKKLPPRPAFRLAALLLNTGEQAEKALARLKVSNEFRREVLLLVKEYGVSCPPERIAVRRRCVELGAENYLKLITLQQAGKEDPSFGRLAALVKELIEEKACLSMKELAVGGRDLMELGYRGPAIGAALERLLEQVTEERLPNERQAILEYLKA